MHQLAKITQPSNKKLTKLKPRLEVAKRWSFCCGGKPPNRSADDFHGRTASKRSKTPKTLTFDV